MGGSDGGLMNPYNVTLILVDKSNYSLGLDVIHEYKEMELGIYNYYRKYFEGLERCNLEAADTAETRSKYYYVYNEDSSIVGFVRITDEDLYDLRSRLLGHIGFDIFPSARRKGNGYKALTAAIALLREKDRESITITCKEDNLPSKKIIEKCGGQFQSEVDDPIFKIKVLIYTV